MPFLTSTAGWHCIALPEPHQHRMMLQRVKTWLQQMGFYNLHFCKRKKETNKQRKEGRKFWMNLRHYSLLLHSSPLQQHDLVHIFRCWPALQMPQHLHHRVVDPSVGVLPGTSCTWSLPRPPQALRGDPAQRLRGAATVCCRIKVSRCGVPSPSHSFFFKSVGDLTDENDSQGEESAAVQAMEQW